MTTKEAFPKQAASAVTAGFRFLNFDGPIKVQDFQTGNRAIVKRAIELQNEHGEILLVPVRTILTFGRPEPEGTIGN